MAKILKKTIIILGIMFLITSCEKKEKTLASLVEKDYQFTKEDYVYDEIRKTYYAKNMIIIYFKEGVPLKKVKAFIKKEDFEVVSVMPDANAIVVKVNDGINTSNELFRIADKTMYYGTIVAFANIIESLPNNNGEYIIKPIPIIYDTQETSEEIGEQVQEIGQEN